MQWNHPKNQLLPIVSRRAPALATVEVHGTLSLAMRSIAASPMMKIITSDCGFQFLCSLPQYVVVVHFTCIETCEENGRKTCKLRQRMARARFYDPYLCGASTRLFFIIENASDCWKSLHARWGVAFYLYFQMVFFSWVFVLIDSW